VTAAYPTDRLARYGYATLRAYLDSPAWQRRRADYFDRHPRECAVCGSRRVQLHHLSYRRVPGREVDRDLLPLCRTHHRAWHRLKDREPWRTRGWLLRELRRRYAVIESMKASRVTAA
jgi:5-methylcytosine-specific restriction endonuclease McrA